MQRRPDAEDAKPLGRAELSRNRTLVEASEAVPAEFDHLERFLKLPTMRRNEVGRDELEAVSAALTPPSRPPWVAGTLRPQRARLSGPPGLKLRHRGSDLEPLFIWNPDDRAVYNDLNYPWGCVCRVVTATGSGSGVIVGPRHVLTASHVVDWATDGAGIVEVHRAGATVAAVSSIAAVWAYSKITGDDVGYSELDEDYAVLVTTERLGDRFGWYGTRTYNSSWDDEAYWWNVGYPGDVAGGSFPIFQRFKELDEDEWDYGPARAMTTSADTMKGQSGGPMFGFWDDGPYVVAVVSAQGAVFFSGDENWCSGGNLLTRLVNHARANDP